MDKNGKVGMLGWVVSAGLMGVLLAGGFTQSEPKFGVVDLQDVVEKSDLYRKNQADIEQMSQQRLALMQFLDTYKVASVDEAQKLRELTLKASPTPADRTALEKLRNDMIAMDKRFKELGTKSNLTEEERTFIRNVSTRPQALDALLQRWDQEFGREMNEQRNKIGQDLIQKARVSVQEVAKQQGYTVILRADLAPYGANDITEASLKSMNAKK